MVEKPQHNDLFNEDFTRRRDAARKRLDAIDPARQKGGALKDPQRREWFEAVYTTADGDAANVPWGNLAAHPLLVEWLAQDPGLAGLTALDVGCGLGDNAAALADRGAEVTAFDFVPRAVEWARSRFAGQQIDFRVADLFAPPPEWREAFDFVHETYTLQALSSELLPAARQALAHFVKPGGRLLVLSRARDEGQEIDGPPWPLARTSIEAFAQCGLVLDKLEDLPPGLVASRHWRALFRKPPSTDGHRA
ncbi:class I SAM-dependent methyltransferase [Rhodoblastus acidophilus]|uniref:Class I SAM-dependent methyltransferase n=1 Tax=Candidatus Rhodoblastus alkanivorans TaxID=2954117 RepID=A0ABS9Z703_9HYPH|nr:class I SAM-dependent methyltransferase [Candidatus Rhodoblastus alkanivorans]MCI4679594.1 class I SAM-dependent methyltransferase [Candidatus Rhodoblastus alkanivorans]MCI4683419.1 class I SAM-dependent methyltransferase [Candidatus Rhodoblastus alkanivorans]MDI4640729.1 class I SAM-dependent methyltransferase [Rhodoblastus acidophilus]